MSEQGLFERSDYALRLYHQGSYDYALRIQLAVLADSERLLGPDHIDTLARASHVAISLWSLGRHREAFDRQTQAFQASARVLGPDHPDTLAARNNLAMIALELGDAEGALEARPDTLPSLVNHAAAHLAAGRRAEALRMNQEALRLAENSLGQDHPSTLTIRNNLAASSSDPAEAVALHEQNLRRRQRVLGPEHPDTLQSGHNLGVCYRENGQLEESAAMLRETLRGFEQTLGRGHPSTAKCRASLAKTLGDT
ncbi:tetratricopeptide repeat protein [Actinoplanes sp. LDG1-06]|uniref:Tetratricopeptide repeat protein n=1 Tax=Paractinoplanes ovalisporus TaxID=2810368 RepID=A0ABS2A9V0_9ACTN|nr:tetratricopeptide repeat protein [Actinoplanes ovalisporus]MBM2616615.1 tetratricopeptide repeat protein [Actinoplanes ovalisporus]